MSAPAVPSFTSAVAAVYRLQMMRLIRGRKLRLGLVAAALVLLAVVITRYADTTTDAVAVMQEGLNWGLFSLLVYLTPFLFTSGAVGEEIEGRTFGYLSSRPAGRPAIALGKYLAGISLTVGLLVASVLLLHLGVYLAMPTELIEELPAALRAMGGLALLALFYGALCMFWGSVAPEAAGIVSVLHLAILEFAATWLPSVFRLVSMNYHARQLAGLPQRDLLSNLGALPPQLSQRYLPPDVPAAASVGVLLGVALLTLACAVWVVRASEYRFAKA